MSKRRPSEFSPKVTIQPDGTVRVRQTAVFTIFEANFAPDEVPMHRHDRHQWVIELCRQWHEHVHPWVIGPHPFRTEDLAYASRFADAVERVLMPMIAQVQAEGGEGRP